MSETTNLLLAVIVILILVAIFVPAGFGIIGSLVSIVFWIIIVIVIIAIVLYLAGLFTRAV
jgi:hypothetical protein